MEVKINTISIDGKKMNASIFKQIEENEMIDYDLAPYEDMIIHGKVRYKLRSRYNSYLGNPIFIDEWILIEREGKLYRCQPPDLQHYIDEIKSNENIIKSIKEFMVRDTAIEELYHQGSNFFNTRIMGSDTTNQYISITYYQSIPKQSKDVFYPIGELNNYLNKELNEYESLLKDSRDLYNNIKSLLDKIEKDIPQIYL